MIADIVPAAVALPVISKCEPWERDHDDPVTHPARGGRNLKCQEGDEAALPASRLIARALDTRAFWSKWMRNRVEMIKFERKVRQSLRPPPPFEMPSPTMGGSREMLGMPVHCRTGRP